MEVQSRLKQLESLFSTTSDRVTAIKGRLDDLLFRAQRIANAMKNNQPNNDMMFGTDLQNFRKELRTLGSEIAAMPQALGSVERLAAYDETSIPFAQSVMRLTTRLAQTLRTLLDTAQLAQHHIRASDHKVHAWYIVQDCEEVCMVGQSLPTTANKIVISVSTPGAPAPKPSAPPAA